jgi:hypothetical protein
VTDEEALALDRRQWAAYMKTLGKREGAAPTLEEEPDAGAVPGLSR